MANPVEMPRQQEKGPEGVSMEVRDLKGSSPWDPRATPSYSSLLCRDRCKAPRGSTFCTRQSLGSRSSRRIPSRMAERRACSLQERDAGFTPDSGQAEQQDGSKGKRRSLSRPGGWQCRAHNPGASEVLRSEGCFHAARANHCIKIFPLRQHRTRRPLC